MSDNIAILKSEHPHIPESSDSEFLETIKENIAFELDSSGVEIFRDAIRDELEKLLRKLKLTSLKNESSNSVAEGLIAALKKGDAQVPVITNTLMNAMRDCFDRRGKHFTVAKQHHNDILVAIEQLLGWLVLASVNDEYVDRLVPSSEFSTAVYFELPVATLGGVEVIVSRSYQRQANVEAQESLLRGKHVTHTKRLNGWKSSEKSNQLMLEIWNKVLPDRKKASGILTRDEKLTLNAALGKRRQRDWYKEHHILAIECSNHENDAAYAETCKQLLNELDQLTLVRFGFSDEQKVFYSLEHDLMMAVSEFLNVINRIIKK